MAVHVEKLKTVKMLVLDVDGVLTDCRIFLDSTGEWRRFFSIRDGYGIQLLKAAGYKTAIITGSKGLDIQERAKVLGIDYLFSGSLDKLPAFEKLQKESGLSGSQMAYMGDDLFDVPILERVAFAATVPEAVPGVLERDFYVTSRPGGNGAVREVCDLIVKHGAFK